MGRSIGLEATVLRIVRIALLTLIPTLALGAFATGCDDDTTPSQDMATTVKPDLAVVSHDMAHGD